MSKSQDLDFYIPHWEELPDIDLYLDQVVTFIDKYLKNSLIAVIYEFTVFEQ